MKIVIFSGYFLPHVGGLETHVDEFSKYLAKRGKFEICIFAPNIPLAPVHERIHEHVDVIRFPAFEVVPNYPVPKFWAPDFWSLIREIGREHPDFVMTRTRFFLTAFLGLLFAKCRFRPMPLIHVEHGSEYVSVSSRATSLLAYLYDMTLGRAVFRYADRVVAISEAVASFVRRAFIRDAAAYEAKVQVIPRGIDFEKYVRVERNLLSEHVDKTKFCYLGRLYKWKGLEHSIAAFRSLDAERQQASVFLIIGYGEDEQRLRELAGADLDKSIFFLGKRDFDEAIALLNACDVYVHSSSPGGGLSNSLLQAMYLRKWVIASPHEGADEVVVDGKLGVLLHDNSVASLRAGMTAQAGVIDDKSYDDFVRSRDWKNVIDRYQSLFQQLCDRT